MANETTAVENTSWNINPANRLARAAAVVASPARFDFTREPLRASDLNLTDVALVEAYGDTDDSVAGHVDCTQRSDSEVADEAWLAFGMEWAELVGAGGLFS